MHFQRVCKCATAAQKINNCNFNTSWLKWTITKLITHTQKSLTYIFCLQLSCATMCKSMPENLGQLFTSLILCKKMRNIMFCYVKFIDQVQLWMYFVCIESIIIIHTCVMISWLCYDLFEYFPMSNLFLFDFIWCSNGRFRYNWICVMIDFILICFVISFFFERKVSEVSFNC